MLEPLLYVGVFYLVFEILLDSRQPDFLYFLMVGKLYLYLVFEERESGREQS